MFLFFRFYSPPRTATRPPGVGILRRVQEKHPVFYWPPLLPSMARWAEDAHPRRPTELSGHFSMGEAGKDSVGNTRWSLQFAARMSVILIDDVD